ncbi:MULTISPECIES: hypothetical protein [Parachlamydia]|uniref:hypothetical protein n=1 Tax=Parachlamydia TaxID=83551 RepID=UPI0024E1B737|nr:hypothetical protein [Parachlamydia acanthamoebae]
MQCPSLSLKCQLSEGIHDAYTASIEIGNAEVKINLVSTTAFDELSEMKLSQLDYYRGNNGSGSTLFKDSRPESARPKITVVNLDRVREILTIKYARLNIHNGNFSLILSPIIGASLKGHNFNIIYYRDKASFESQKEAIFLPKTAIYVFTEEEFAGAYIEAAHRIQKFFYYAIFPQGKKTETSWIGKAKQYFNVKGDLSQYLPGAPYLIELKLPKEKHKEERGFLGYSTAPSGTSSDTSFTSVPSESSGEEFHSASPGSPGSSSSSMDSNLEDIAINRSHPTINTRRGPIEEFKGMVDEINQILKKRGLNRESNSSGNRRFTLSIHFKEGISDPKAIQLTTWTKNFGRSSALCYGVPMKIEISFEDESSESFEYILKSNVQVPLSAPKWEGWFAKMSVPRTCEAARKNALFETYLDAFAMRNLLMLALHENYKKAQQKIDTICYSEQGLWTTAVPHISYESRDFKKRWESHFNILKNQEVKWLGIGDRVEDPDLVVFDLTKIGFPMSKPVKLEVDNPVFAP